MAAATSLVFVGIFRFRFGEEGSYSMGVDSSTSTSLTCFLALGLDGHLFAARLGRPLAFGFMGLTSSGSTWDGISGAISGISSPW